ncbi:YgeY family selenium metabolism-linked hydrolase [Cupriavidus numazuensis]|uniref:Succinyl-diaminopimelate desuccinylase n=1 Tax=Cupriavidus numazuensis TaxID=221992 RepID=A0ABM8TUA7_9BURK|nr:YgeY family selenium metabolism-linked hydrolase [Cupriavidus numazuensis]CAG2160128.1 Succinyl-diaminopimelate desuccinylase [Cupriavidus numazuensis]
MNDQTDNLSDVIALTREMVRIPSLSGREGDVAALLARRMTEAGFTSVTTDSNGSVLGLIGPEDTEVALLFDGHMDVVPVTGQWRFDPFGGTIHDGRLYGRGTTDMKGGIAAAICGVAAAARERPLRRRIAVSASVLEEIIEGHALASVLDRCRPAAVVICEPSKLQIKRGQKGRLEILLTFHGIPAHAATPHLGVNPLHAAARALTALEGLNLPTDPILGAALLVPTDIVSAPYPSISMIPTSTTIRFDRRTLDGETREDVLGQIDACLRTAGLHDFTLAVSDDEVRTFTGESARPTRWLPAWQQPDSTSLVQAAVRAVTQAGHSPQVGTWAFCTNGSESAGRRQIPTIGLGPGCEEDAHTIDESIALEQLDGAREIYRKLVLEMA